MGLSASSCGAQGTGPSERRIEQDGTIPGLAHRGPVQAIAASSETELSPALRHPNHKHRVWILVKISKEYCPYYVRGLSTSGRGAQGTGPSERSIEQDGTVPVLAPKGPVQAIAASSETELSPGLRITVTARTILGCGQCPR